MLFWILVIYLDYILAVLTCVVSIEFHAQIYEYYVRVAKYFLFPKTIFEHKTPPEVKYFHTFVAQVRKICFRQSNPAQSTPEG